MRALRRDVVGLMLMTLLVVASFVVTVVAVVGLVRLTPPAPPVEQEVVSLERLMAVSGFTKRSDLIDDALNFYEAMTEQAMKGNLVGYMDRNREFTQVLTKGMQWAKEAGRITGAGDES